MELPSPDDGVLVEVIKNDGDTVTAGEVIAKIDTEAKIKSDLKNANSNIKVLILKYQILQRVKKFSRLQLQR